MTSGMQQALLASQRPAQSGDAPLPVIVWFLSMEFRSGTAYLNTTASSISWNSNTWLGGGRVLNLSPVEEGSNVGARGIVVSLSGIDAALLPGVLSDYKVDGVVKLWLGALDGGTGSLIPDPIPAWFGRIDQPRVRYAGSLATIEVSCENRLIVNGIAPDRRRTHDDQQLVALGDLAFSEVNSLQELTISFGQSTISTRNI